MYMYYSNAISKLGRIRKQNPIKPLLFKLSSIFLTQKENTKYTDLLFFF